MKETIEDMVEDAGKKLSKKLSKSFRPSQAVVWFYNSPVPLLGWRKPYEAVQDGDENEVYSVLDNIEKNNRLKYVRTLAGKEILEILEEKLDTEKILEVFKAPRDQYGGKSMEALCREGKMLYLLKDLKESFDWAATT